MQKTTQTTEQLEQIFSETRLKVDQLFRLVENIPGSANNTKAINHLKMSKGWFGKCKGSLGIPTPYAPSTTETGIPPTDAVSQPETDGLALTKLETINSVRETIKNIVNDFKPGNINPDWEAIGFDSFLSMQISVAIINLEEASMWLGYELSDMRDNALLNETKTA